MQGLTIRIPDEIRRRAEQVAEKEGVSVAHLVRRGLLKLVESFEQNHSLRHKTSQE